MLLFKKLPESFTNAQKKTYSNNIFSENAAKPPPLCLPHAGKALFVDIVFPTYACIRSDNRGIAVFSYRCLPHWGRGTAPAVDRVLSYIVDLRRISPLFFIPPSPSNLRPFGAPPSIGRRERPREPLPLEGAAERSEAGLASFFAAKLPPLSLPHWGRGTASAVDRVLS